jgi:hypothetical protein
MSKLIQRIEQVARAAPQPMGFGAAARKQPAPAFVLLASCTSEEQLLALGPGQADAVLFTPDSVDVEKLAQAGSALGDTPWGVRLSQGGQENVELLQTKGCDFIAFLPGAVSLDALQGEEMGRLLVVTPDMEKEQAHILEDLPLDAAILARTLPKRLSLELLLELAAQRNQISKAVLLPVAGALTPWELECLRNIGVEGVVLNLDQADADALRTLQERIRELPRRKPKAERAVAYLPQPSLAGSRSPGHEEEEEEEEDDAL